MAKLTPTGGAGRGFFGRSFGNERLDCGCSAEYHWTEVLADIHRCEDCADCMEAPGRETPITARGVAMVRPEQTTAQIPRTNNPTKEYD